MPTYKTPDVYVEEISLFPPSVAEVETAIPAFIGYTEKATRISSGDLLKTPTRLTSLLQFEGYFGKGPKVALSEVVLDDGNNFVRAALTNQYYLYDSLRLFYDNGGGPCYIVSVGNYSDAVERDALKAGVDTLLMVDEPTLLLFPDAAALAADQLGFVQQQALKQCGKLKDRFCILDTRRDDPNGTAFRGQIGINDLKYGAAYAPWLKINYSKNISYGDVKGVIKKRTVTVNLASLTTEQDIKDSIKRLDDSLDDVAAIKAKTAAALGGATSITSKYNDLLSAYKTNRTLAHMQAVFQFLFLLADSVDGLLDAASGVKNQDLKTEITNTIAHSLKPAYTELIAAEIELDAKVTDAYTPQWDVDPDPAAPQWGNLFTTSPPAASAVIPGAAATDADRADALLAIIDKNFRIIDDAIQRIAGGAKQNLTNSDARLYDLYPVYKNIILGIHATLTVSPPSGAVAGAYAAIDNQRGVWKAPANYSLAGVIEPAHHFTSDETDALNVDPNAGKSINAIRAFAGKGTLIWGARTLAGNDQEWRFVPVRRFFNMVEESIKKSTCWAVFEPNDANTWVKVRGMIENYLTQKWREGALAGATPKDAFFVKCGLGTTMTAVDILEGRMNVEIGMAVVRPAEFIILRFSHKLQTS